MLLCCVKLILNAGALRRSTARDPESKNRCIVAENDEFVIDACLSIVQFVTNRVCRAMESGHFFSAKPGTQKPAYPVVHCGTIEAASSIPELIRVKTSIAAAHNLECCPRAALT
jgi:hypothetical protein